MQIIIIFPQETLTDFIFNYNYQLAIFTQTAARFNPLIQFLQCGTRMPFF
jgi:hypothetical protein